MIFDKADALAGVSRHDYLPFGEEIFADTGGRTTTQGYSVTEGVRQKFTSKERDTETGLDYFLARYYSSTQGRFTGVDPLAASASPIRAQSWNRYSYSYNNPLRYTDPSGMIAGDFYDLDGRNIGSDGVNDGRKYIVYDKKEAKQIENTTGNYTGTVTNKVTIASADVVTGIEAAVTRSDGATFAGQLASNETATGGFAEAGLSWKTNNGSTRVTDAANGPASDPRPSSKAAEISLPANADGKGHVHPSGEITATSGPKQPIAGMTIGGATTISKSHFDQQPSAVDVANAIPNGTNIVVGARDKTVYFYGASGNRPPKDCHCIAKMSLKNFSKIK
jgi:RHS repeat-associated protein